MNNNLFAVTRYLRDMGYDAELLLFEGEFDQFHPAQDTFDEDFRNYAKEIPWSNLPTVLYNRTAKEIQELIDQYDFVIGCGTTPAFFSKAQRKLDLFIPYGSDITQVPRLNLFKAPLRKVHRYYSLKQHQKRGIIEAEHVLMEYSNDDFENSIVHLNIGHKRITASCPFIYLPQYENYERYKNLSTLYDRFKEIRDNHDLMVISHSRHEWVGYKEGSAWNKANDKLIKGFANLLKNNPDKKAALVFFEYGNDVRHSKALIAELGIESYVHWLPLSPRKEIMVGIEMADIGVGELNASFLTYGVVCECLAVGTPVMHYREDELYSNYKELYPMLNANSIDTVEKGLQAVMDNPGIYKEMGMKGKGWLKKYIIDHPLGIIEKLINDKLSLTERPEQEQAPVTSDIHAFTESEDTVK